MFKTEDTVEEFKLIQDENAYENRDTSGLKEAVPAPCLE